MKLKRLAVCLSMAVIVSAVSGCLNVEVTKNNSTENTSTGTAGNNASASDTGTQAWDSITQVQEESGEQIPENTVTEAELRNLIDNNIYCMFNVFDLGTLPTTGEPVDGTNLYQVDTDIFKNYSEFEEYVRSIYSKDWADTLLYNYPYEGVRLYSEVDGKLYVDMTYAGAKGYYVDWNDYSVQIDTVKAGICEFTIKTSVEWPADNPVKEDYILNETAVYENGGWRLTRIIY